MFASLTASAQPTPSQGTEGEGTEVSPQRSRSDDEDFDEPITDERRAELEESLNFLNSPGQHTVRSPVVGSRAAEYEEIRNAALDNPAFADFVNAVYQPRLIHLIPKNKKKKADKIAMALFQQYIRKYEDAGVTMENIVEWVRTGHPGAASNKTWVYDSENEHNTWRVHAIIEAADNWENDLFLSKYTVAYHEVMHVEEISLRAPESIQNNDLRELITTVKTIILADAIYKKIYGLQLQTSVDHHQNVQWNGHSMSVGALANFYRDLETTHGTLAQALISEESLNLINNGP
ncbi:MAG: hypothetical protein HYT79_07375 [Elusimicrobia bacterium]|nr:hypothetical protein [Elusimicrobiota bacterium]